jgi:hypothetical protein
MIQSPFPYGELVNPEHDLLDTLFGEISRDRMCVTATMLDAIAQHAPQIDQWDRHDMGTIWWRRRSDGLNVLIVSRGKHGWRACGRFLQKGDLGVPHDLSYAVANQAAIFPPLIFPSAISAISAAEMLSPSEHMEVASMVWTSPKFAQLVRGVFVG